MSIYSITKITAMLYLSLHTQPVNVSKTEISLFYF